MHSAKSLSSISVDDLPFRHYSLKHRAIAWISRRLFDRASYTVRHGLIRGLRRRGGLGWVPAFVAGSAQTKEEMFWSALPLTGLVVYDIGAYHGILTMFFAVRCAQVIAYEPNETNHARLVDNVCLNNLINVQVRKLGLGSYRGPGLLRFSPGMAGGGTLDSKALAPVSQPVKITTLDHDIAVAELPVPDLIKIDIEGWELRALEGAQATLAKHHPALFLEMHGETMREKKRKVREIIGFLHAAGYDNIVHVESGSAITPGNENLAAEGHLYCQYTASRSQPCQIKACPTNTSPPKLKASSASSH
jgi:FkbM family methyltransferase